MSKVFFVRRICLALALLLTAGALCACGPDTAETRTETLTETETESETQPLTEGTYMLSEMAGKYRVLGRSMTDGTGITMNWSATTLDFNAYCTGDVSVTFTSEAGVAVRVYVDGRDKGLVYINTQTPADILENGFDEVQGSGTVTVRIASDLAEGKHTFRVVKASLSDYVLTAQAVTLCGYFTEPPTDTETYVIFYGNSLMDGYGVYPDICNKYRIPDAPIYESRIRCYIDDATRTFAYRTAVALKTDYEYTAFSGMGWIWGAIPKQFTEIYDYVDYFHDEDTKMDFTNARTPDVIVFTLSGNDGAWWAATTDAESEAWETGVKEFLRGLRAQYGTDVPFVFVSGIFPYDLVKKMQKIANDEGGEENGYYFLYMENDTHGIGAHPSEKEAKEEAEILTAFMREKFPDLFGKQ